MDTEAVRTNSPATRNSWVSVSPVRQIIGAGSETFAAALRDLIPASLTASWKALKSSANLLAFLAVAGVSFVAVGAVGADPLRAATMLRKSPIVHPSLFR
jgi:hypothetical protein